MGLELFKDIKQRLDEVRSFSQTTEETPTNNDKKIIDDIEEQDYLESVCNPDHQNFKSSSYEPESLRDNNFSHSSTNTTNSNSQTLLQPAKTILLNIQSKSDKLKEYIRKNQGTQNRLMLAPYDMIQQTSMLYAEQGIKVLDNESISFHFDKVDSMRIDQYIFEYVRYLTEWNQLCLELAEEKKLFFSELKNIQELTQMFGKINNNIFKSLNTSLQQLITEYKQIEADLEINLNNHLNANTSQK